MFYHHIKCIMNDEKTCRVCKKKIGNRSSLEYSSSLTLSSYYGWSTYPLPLTMVYQHTTSLLLSFINIPLPLPMVCQHTHYPLPLTMVDQHTPPSYYLLSTYPLPLTMVGQH